MIGGSQRAGQPRAHDGLTGDARCRNLALVYRRAFLLALVAVLLHGCAAVRRQGPPKSEREVTVTAYAYNSTKAQTDGRPGETASGDHLKPGMKVIAVSRDLEELGLTFGTKVRIEGLDGTWTVLDRMHGRHRRAIDVYMGSDVAAARRWGKRSVIVRWTTKR